MKSISKIEKDHIIQIKMEWCGRKKKQMKEKLLIGLAHYKALSKELQNLNKE